MSSNGQHLVLIPQEDYLAIKEGQEKILRVLQNLNLTPAPEYLTAQEFMDQCKIKRWSFDMIKNSGLLKLKRIGRKYYVPRSEVQRFFNGELRLPD